jgi:esterase/lipase
MNGYLVRGHMKFCETLQQDEEDTQLQKYVDYVKNTQEYKNKNIQDFELSKHYDTVDNGEGVTLYDLSKAMFELTAIATKLGYTHKELMHLTQHKSL